MDDEPSPPEVEEVLAVGLRAEKPAPVQPTRLGREAALRRGHANGAAAEVARVAAGEAVDRVAFGHPAIVSKEKAGDRSPPPSDFRIPNPD